MEKTKKVIPKKKLPLKSEEDKLKEWSVQKFEDLLSRNNIPITGLTEEIIYNLEKKIQEYVEEKVRAFNINHTGMEEDKLKDLYLSKVRSVITNLDDKSYVNNTTENDSNESVLLKLMRSEILPEQVVKLSPQELAPKRWESLVAQRMHEAKIHSQNLSIGTTDLFRCGKCKQKKCSYYQLQTRSQDEAITTFITCTNCGNKWRE